MRFTRPLLACCLALAVVGAATGCGGSGPARSAGTTTLVADAPLHRGSSTAAAAPRRYRVPPSLAPNDVYAADRPGRLAPAVRGFPSRVYVPNSESNTVSVIDPRSYKVIDTFPVGRLPQHVTPSYDLKTLWVLNDEGNSV